MHEGYQTAGQFRDQRGLSLLVVVVVVGAAALIMVLGSSMLSIGDLDVGHTADQSQDALLYADGCAEEGLRRLRLDSGYAGGTLSDGDHSCIMSITTAGSDRIIIVTSTLNAVQSVIQVNATLSGSTVTVNSWQRL